VVRKQRGLHVSLRTTGDATMNLHRRLNLVTPFLALLCVQAAWSSVALSASGLVRDDQALRFGLKRAWFTQVDVNPGRNAVEQAVLAGDELAVLTTAGVLHMLDAHTGATRWVERIGNPRYSSLGPAVTDTHVALINGSTLYVFDRATHLEVLRESVGGGPAASPAMSAEYLFVPLFNGRIEGYSITDPDAPTWYYQSAGRLYMSPITTRNRVVWASDMGYLYGADNRGEGIRYRFESLAPIAAPPAAKSPYIFAVAEDGYVFALNEDTGRLRWRYSTGWPARFSPVAIGDSLYVTTDEPALHCVATEDGTLRWTALDVSRFVGASPTRVYGMDRYGTLMVLDGRSGVELGQASGSQGTSAVANDRTDRLYLVSDSGLVQCLHEVGQPQPFLHPQPTFDEPAAEKPAPAGEVPLPETPPADEPPAVEPPPDAGDPFAEGVAEPPAADEEPATDEPAADPFAEEM
jgi:hypothetical protein